MSEKFQIVSIPNLGFKNGYQVFFEPGGIPPYSVFTHVWYKGEKQPLEMFSPDNMNGYVTTDEFARMLHQVSKAASPDKRGGRIMFSLVIDVPGERPVKHYFYTRGEALKMARSYLLMNGMVTIYDTVGREIYRHAKPFTRNHYKEKVHV